MGAPAAHVVHPTPAHHDHTTAAQGEGEDENENEEEKRKTVIKNENENEEGRKRNEKERGKGEGEGEKMKVMVMKLINVLNEKRSRNGRYLSSISFDLSTRKACATANGCSSLNEKMCAEK